MKISWQKAHLPEIGRFADPAKSSGNTVGFRRIVNTVPKYLKIPASFGRIFAALRQSTSL